MITSLSEVLQKAYDEKELANDRYQELSNPLVRDYALMDEFWEWFQKREGNRGSTIENRVFVVLMVVVYNPSYLVEGRLRKSVLRNRLSQQLEMHPNRMSVYIADSFFWYKNYIEFQQYVDRCMQDFKSKFLTNDLESLYKTYVY